MSASQSADPARAERLLADADKASKAEDIEKAALLYRECLTLTPENPRIQLKLAMTLIKLDRADEAADLLNEALRASWDSVTLLNLARLLIEEVQWSMAEDILTRFIAAVPNHSPALLIYAELLSEQCQPERAREIYKEILEREPRDITALIRFLSLDYGSEGIDAIHAALSAAGDSPERVELLQILTDQTERNRRAASGLPRVWSVGVEDMNLRFATQELANYREAAIQWSERAPEERRLWAHRAVAAFSSNDIQEAERCFAVVRKHPVRDLARHTTFDHDFYARLDSLTLAEIVGDLPEVHLITPRHEPSGPVFFMSCDFDYLINYARPLLRSIEENARNADVHVHVVNASAEQLSIFRKWADALDEVHVAISTETVTPAQLAGPAAAYYVSIRYVRFAQYLAEYGQTMCMMDVDCLMNRDLREAISELPSFDIALRVQPCALEPWNRFAGGAMIAKPSEGGQRYVKLVAGFVHSYHQQNLLRWGIDQLALYSCYRYMADIDAAPVLCPLSEEAMALEDRETGFLWCQPGRFKKRVRLYAARNLPDSGIRQSNYVRALKKFSA